MSNPLREIEDYFPDFRHDLADKVPEHLRAGLALYIIHGVRPGSFLSAVISNDLHGAIRYGDDASLAATKQVITFLWNSAPSACFGSNLRFNEWAGLVRKDAA